MTEALLIAILNTVARVGIDSTLILLDAMKRPAPTIDDAIAALRAAQSKTWEQYQAEVTPKS